jgi:hypothetical protein
VVFGGTSATITVAGDATHNLHLVAALNMPGKTLAKEGPGTLTTAAITAGTVNHNAGTLAAASVTAGTFNVNSTALVTGLVNVSGTTTVAVGKSLTAGSQTGGSLTVYGAAGYGTGAVDLTGTATVGNGAALAAFTAGAVTADHFNVASGSAQMTTLTGTDPGTSTVSVAAGHSLNVDRNLTNVNVLTVDGTATLHSLSTEGAVNETSIVQHLALNGAGTLDVTQGNLIVKDSTQLLPIRGWLRSGANYDVINSVDQWDGAGITSSTVRNGDVYLYSVGLRSAGEDVWGAYGAMTDLEGVAVAPTDIVLKYTYSGDPNLDGKVDSDDYLVLDFYYSLMGTPDQPAEIGWWNGDLNHDGTIDSNDYILLDYAFSQYWTDFNTQTTNPDLTTPLPEPATLALLLLGGVAMLARRRRAAK